MRKKRTISESRSELFLIQAQKRVEVICGQIRELEDSQSTPNEDLNLISLQTILEYVRTPSSPHGEKENVKLEEPSSFASSLAKPQLMLESILGKCGLLLRKLQATSPLPKPSKSNLLGLFFCVLALIFYFELHTPPGFTRLWLKWENVDLRSVECTIERPQYFMEVFRPPLTCDFCRNVSGADRIANITPSEFESRYAYSGRPVIISDAMSNWSAPSTFTFDFLKSIYSEGSRSLEHLGEDCLFFPYQTEFKSLGEVFNMTKERRKKRWYIGWSNCDVEASGILRQHYQRPYFLPYGSESTHADWLFMGLPGLGAHMHIDHVIHASWQAQITGRKIWFLQPPPECFYQCQSFQIGVSPGEIIVIDTNRWYHQTQILHDETSESDGLSITIGSEFD